MYNCLSYTLEFLALKSLFKALFLYFASIKRGTWFLGFFMQVYINYFNIFFVESRTKIGVGPGSKKEIFNKAILD